MYTHMTYYAYKPCVTHNENIHEIKPQMKVFFSFSFDTILLFLLLLLFWVIACAVQSSIFRYLKCFMHGRIYEDFLKKPKERTKKEKTQCNDLNAIFEYE